MKKWIGMLNIAVLLVLCLTSCGTPQDAPVLADAVLICLKDSASPAEQLVRKEMERLCEGKKLEIIAIDDTELAYAAALEKAFVELNAPLAAVIGFEGRTESYAALYPDRKILRFVSRTPVFCAENEGYVLVGDVACGFIAGYAYVTCGGRNLGFIGVEGDAAADMGFGLIQGANTAAKDLGLEEREADIRYWYCGTENTPEENSLVAGAWKKQGTDTVFTYGCLLDPAAADGPAGFALEGCRECLEEPVTRALLDLLSGMDMVEYKDCSYALKPSAMPHCLTAFEGMSQPVYEGILSTLFKRVKFDSLSTHANSDVYGNPEKIFNALVIRLEFFG